MKILRGRRESGQRRFSGSDAAARGLRALLIPLLAFVALGSWAIASPVGSSPDDDFHLNSIWCANEAKTAECGRTAVVDERVSPLAFQQICFAQRPTESAACLDELLAQSPPPKRTTIRGNFDGLYPPVYYGTMSIFAGTDLVSSVLLMRFVNIGLFLSLSTALFYLLDRQRRPALVLGWVISTVPLGMFLLASNNPSAWGMIGIGSAWISLLGYFESEGRRKLSLAGVFVVSALMAAGSRSDAATYLAVAIGVVLILCARLTRRFLVEALLPLAMVGVAFAFFLTSNQSAVAVEGFDAGTAVRPDRFDLLSQNVQNLPSLWTGVWGTWGLGWLDTGLPVVVSFCAVGVFCAVAFTGLRHHSRRKLLAVTALALLLVVLPLYVLDRGGQLVGSALQPRYLLPLIVLFSGVVLLTTGTQRISLSSPQIVVIVVLLAGANSLALHTNLRRYTTGTDARGWNLDRGYEWWWALPFSPMAVFIVGSMAYAVAVFLLLRNVGARLPDVVVHTAESPAYPVDAAREVSRTPEPRGRGASRADSRPPT